ncbi:MAG: Fic family protein [Gemmatimonadaceae bacterium]
MPGRLIKRTWTSNSTAHAPRRHRRACKYAAFVPDVLATLDVRLEGAVAGVVSEAEDAIRRLNVESGAALAPLARFLLRSESIASSRIEGLQVGIRQLARAEAAQDAGEAPGVTAMELLANIDAMVLAVDHAADAAAFKVDHIIAIHRRLMQRTPHKHIAGKIREEQNWIGGNDYTPCDADFVPPPPENVKPLLADLCRAINDDMLPPVVQAALVHAQFETIHPFGDGNGRTGRALIHVVLRRRGLTPRFIPPVSVILARSRDRYIAQLTGFRGASVTEWIEHFAAATVSAARLADEYVGAVRALQDEWRSRLQASGVGPRAGAAAWAIIDVLPEHPMITGPVAIAATDRARASVYEALDQLEEAGVLIPLSKARRGRWWEADGMLDLIERIDAGASP